MDTSVTPIKRRRRSEADDEGDYENDSAVNGSGDSRESKRARRHTGDDNVGNDAADGGSQSPERPLLPDNFRRSPQNGRTRDMLPNGDTESTRSHQPGSIVRVSLIDFVNYTSANFHPGPNLNMIIGPNGTGKSTLVCAICLGLGWSTANLGRAKDIGEFVKHGRRRATIEIELARDPSRQQENPVITTKITKEGNKTDFLMDGRKSTKKAVRELAKSFSIQVDNLCQFLPQDRVVEFAALSPVDLLAQTQRAAAPDYMSEWHEQLKAMRREQKTKLDDQQRDAETLKNMENRQAAAKPDYDRLKERGDITERKKIMERFRPFPQYRVKKLEFDEVKKSYKTAAKELETLTRQKDADMAPLNAKRDYVERIQNVRDRRDRFVRLAEQTAKDQKKKHDNADEKINEANEEVEAEKNNIKQTKQGMPELQRSLNEIEKVIQKGGPQDFDPAEYNSRIRDLARQIREKDSEIQDLDSQRGTLRAQGAQKRQVIENAEGEKENLASQAGQQASLLRKASRNGDAATAWDWIQANRSRFTGEVFGPPVVECTIKEKRNAAAVESVIGQGEMLAFTVTNQQDFDMLQQQLYGKMRLTDISIRTSLAPMSAFESRVPEQQLRQLGLECYMLDLIEGPEPVLAMLCDNRNIHTYAFTSQDITNQQYEALENSPISSYVTATQTYQTVRRAEYGPQAKSTRVTALRGARFFTDTPMDTSHSHTLDESIREAKNDLQEIAYQDKDLGTRRKTLDGEKKELEAEKGKFQSEKDSKSRAQAMFSALPTKRDGIRAKIDEAHEKINRSKECQREIQEKAESLSLEKGQLALDYANSVHTLQNLIHQFLEAEIVLIEAKSDAEQLEIQQRDAVAALERKTAEVQTFAQRRDEVKATAMALMKECRTIIPEEGLLDSMQQEIHDLVIGADEGSEPWSPERLEGEIDRLESQLEMTAGGGSADLIAEYDERARKITRLRGNMEGMLEQLRELHEKITEVRQRWEPELNALVAQISEAFTENFSRIHCAGEVAVYKDDDDFDEWAIQIKVKFRENEPLSILDSHRQSGGERAVSTIFYLMALQSLARAPFRVVDEINQGMDPRNERLVHSRMVDIACAEHTSQYFLITPKLLNGLRFHEKMTVHCIASGEHMPENGHRELDFHRLAERALDVMASKA